MIRTTVTAVLITALFTAICCGAGWYTSTDATVVAVALPVVLAAMVQRHVRRNSVRPGRTRTKPVAQPRWLAIVLACVALAAPAAAWGAGTVTRWTCDLIMDADRSQVEATWHKLREEGKWQQAADHLRQRLSEPASDRWRHSLRDALCEALLNRASCADDDQAESLLHEASQIAQQQRVHPDLARALSDRLEQRTRRQALEAELSKARQVQAERDQLYATQLSKLQDAAGGQQRAAAEAEVALHLRLGDALRKDFEQRRKEYEQAHTIAVQHGLDTLRADQALATLDQEIAALRPITLDPKVQLHPIRSQLGDTSPVRIVDFTMDALPGVQVPALQIKDFAAFQHQQPTAVLAMDRLDRSQQRLQLAILLDASSSMRGARMDEAKRETGQLVEDLSSWADISVFTFRDTAQRIVDWKADRRVASQAIAGLQAQGGTALLRAVETAVAELGRRPYPRAIVLLTDGKDSVGGRPASELARMARDQGVAIYAVGFTTEETDFPLLQELADSTSGSMQAVDGVGRLAMHFAEIAAALRRPAYRVVLPAGDSDDDWTLRVGTNHTLRLEAFHTARGAHRP